MNKKVYVIKNPDKFKKMNLSDWHKNSNFWLEGKMRHLRDISKHTKKLLMKIYYNMGHCTKKPKIVDLGCGEGWILRLIRKSGLNVEYTGIDFNIKFINALKRKHMGDKNANFIYFDLEKNLDKDLIEKFDIGLNFFNFFETPNIEKAFSNAYKLLKPNGFFLICNIDPLTQILAISQNHEIFIENLKLYERFKSSLGYDKDIDIGDFKSDRTYHAILYSTQTYVSLAKQNDMSVQDYSEVIKTGNYVPQIYQFLILKKSK